MQFKKSLLGVFVAALCVCGVVIFRAPERPDADVPASDAVSESVPRARRAVAPKDSDSLAALPPETPEPTVAFADPAELRRERRESSGVAEPLAWHAAGTLPRKGETFRAEFFDDVAFDFRVEKAERLVAAGKEMTVVRGRTHADGLLNAVCVVSEGRALVSVNDFEQARAYALAYDFARGAYFSAERDVTKEAGCGTCAELHAHDAEALSPSAAAPAFAADDPVALSASFPVAAGTSADGDKLVLDYLAIFDTTGAAYAERNGGLASLSATVVASMNNCFENSNIAAEYRLSGVETLTYTAHGEDFNSDLGFITADSNIAALRENAGADIVQLYINPTSYSVGGLGWVGPFKNYMFSVVRAAQAGASSYSAAHECGHNLGCYHARGQYDSPETIHEYAFGFDGTHYHTVMSYGLNGTPKAPIFSGLNSVYGGETLGSAIEDCVRMITESAPVTAGYFSPKSSILNVSKLEYSASGGEIGFKARADLSWTIMQIPEWISLRDFDGNALKVEHTHTAHTGSVSIYASAAPLENYESRSGVIEFLASDGNRHYVVVNQHPGDPTYLTISEEVPQVIAFQGLIKWASNYTGEWVEYHGDQRIYSNAFDSDGIVLFPTKEVDQNDLFICPLSWPRRELNIWPQNYRDGNGNTSGKFLWTRLKFRTSANASLTGYFHFVRDYVPENSNERRIIFSENGVCDYNWDEERGICVPTKTFYYNFDTVKDGERTEWEVVRSVCGEGDYPWISADNNGKIAVETNSGATRSAKLAMVVQHYCSGEGVRTEERLLTVTQVGANGIDFNENRKFPKKGGAFPLTVRADWDTSAPNWPSNYSWSAQVSADWLSLSQTSGTGDGELTLTATENTTGEERAATVVATVNGVQYSVLVCQETDATYLNLSENIKPLYVERGANVIVESDVVESDVAVECFPRGEIAEYATVTFCGNELLVVTNERRPEHYVTGEVVFRAGSLEKTLRIVLLPAAVDDGTDAFRLNTVSRFYEADYTASWGYSTSGTEALESVQSNVSWLTARVNDGKTYFYAFASKNTGATREGTVTVISEAGSQCTFTICQLGGNGIDFDAKTCVFEKEGGSFPLTIRADWDAGAEVWPANWSVSTDADWLTLSEASGTGDKMLTLTAAPNSGGNRTATVTATINGTEYSLEVTQWGTATYLTVSDSVPGVVALNAWSSSVVNYADVVSTDGAVECFFEGGSADRFVLDETAFAQGTLKISTNAANASGEFLFSTLVLKAGSLEQRIRVVQVPCGIDDGTDAFRLNTVSRFYEADFTASWSYSTSGTEALESVESNVSWLTARVNEGKTYFYAFASKNTGATREGTVTVISEAGSQCTFTIYQLGGNGIDFDVKTRVFEKEGGSFPLTIRADWDAGAEVWPANWSVSTDADWLTLSEASGTGDKMLTLTAAPNSGGNRTATVTATINGTDYVVTVSQVGITPELMLSLDSWSVPVEGGVQSVSLTSNTSWTATSSAEWLRVSPESGQEDGVLTLTAEPNAGVARTATVTVVAGTLTKRITVTQDGFEPTLGLSLDSWSVPVEGGVQSVSLTSNTSWTATSSAEWLRVSPESGQEDGVLTLTADPNAGVARTATVTVVAGTLTKRITVTQGGFEPTLELSLDSWSVPVVGGEQSVSLTSNTSWTATSSAEWLRVSPESGQEDGVLTLTADPNAGVARTATVTVVAGTLTKRITVTQKVLVASLSLGAVNNFRWEGGVESLTIYSTIPWTIESAESWLTPQTRSGYGSTVISLIAEKNSANAVRKALVIVKAGSLTRTLTVSQAAAPEMILPGKTVCIVDKNVGTYRIAFTANVPVKAVSKDAWISVKIENGEVVLTLEANPLYAVRKGTVELTNAAGTMLNQIFVEQDAGEAKFSVNDEKPLSLPSTGITMSFPVEANMAWRVEAGEDCETWLSVANGSTTGVAPAGVGTLTLSCKKNPEIEARTGTVVFTCADAAGEFTETRTYVVTQSAGDPEVSLSKGTLSTSFRAATLKTTLTANTDWRLETELPEWLTISPASGSAGDAIELTIEVAKHESSEAERSATAMFVCGASKATLTVTQGAFETIRAEFDSLTFSSRASSRRMKIYPNGAWKVELPGDWMKSNALEGVRPESGIAQLTLEVSANASASPREGVLVLECGETRVEIPVRQQRAYDNPTEIEKAGVPEFSAFSYADESDYVRVAAEGGECACELDLTTVFPGVVFSLNPDWLDCELSGNPPTLWVQAIPNFGDVRETWVFVLTADGELYAVPVRQEAHL